jgi:hypothetical protein
VTIPVPRVSPFGLSLWAESAVHLVSDFDPEDVVGWSRLVDFNPTFDNAGMWNSAGDFWQIPDNAPPQIIVRMTAQGRIDNTGAGASGAGLGFGTQANDPFNTPRAAVYVAQQVARRQDFAAVALQLTTPFFLGGPGDVFTYWLFQDIAGSLDVLAGGVLGAAVPPSHTWWAIEVWS